MDSAKKVVLDHLQPPTLAARRRPRGKKGTTVMAADGRLPCSQCDKTFANMKHLKRHAVTTHDQAEPFACTRCSRTFGRLDSLQRHEKRQKEGSDGVLRCPVRAVAVPRRKAATPAGEEQAVASTSRVPMDEDPREDSSASWDGGVDTSPTQQPDPVGMSPLVMLSELSGVPDPQDQYSLPPMGHSAYDPLLSMPVPPPHLMSKEAQHMSFLDMTSSSDALDAWLNPTYFAEMLAVTLQSDNTSPWEMSAAAPTEVLDAPIEESSHTDAFEGLMGMQRGQQPFPALDGLLPISEAKAKAVREATSVDWSRAYMDKGKAASSMEARDAQKDVGTLASQLNIVGEGAVDPADLLGSSFDFVDQCVSCYFRKFTPLFPILHSATFRRGDTAPLLLLSIVSIGAVFLGTTSALKRGRTIYARLNKLVLSCWNHRMEEGGFDQRMAIVQTAVLGQTFGFCSSMPSALFTSDVFHSTVTAVRSIIAANPGRSMWLNQSDEQWMKKEATDGNLRSPEYTAADLATLSPENLDSVWRSWAKAESVRRTAVALGIHEAVFRPSAVHIEFFSSLTPDTIASDTLFEAQSAPQWLNAHLQIESGNVKPSCIFREVFVACQISIRARALRAVIPLPMFNDMVAAELRPALFKTRDGLNDAASFRSTAASTVHPILSPSELDPFDVLVTFLGVGLYVDLGHLNRAFGVEDYTSAIVAAGELAEWAVSKEAAQAVSQSARVLHLVSTSRLLQPSAIHYPLAIYQASLTIFAYLALSPTIDYSGTAKRVDLTDLAATAAPVDFAGLSSPRTPRIRPRLANFFEGDNRKMDAVQLLTTSARLLEQSTEWGIGRRLSRVLLVLSEFN